MTADEKQAYLESLAAQIGEHFDCVQILAHDSDADSYQEYAAGAGSLYARQYQADRWSTNPTQTPNDDEEDNDDQFEPTGD